MQSVSYKCRCCLKECEQINYIYDYMYVKMFRETLNFLPATDPRLPQGICSRCVHSLNEAKRFKDMTVAAERELLLVLSTTCEHDTKIMSTSVLIKIEPCEMTLKASAAAPVDSVWIKEEARDMDAEQRADDEALLPSATGARARGAAEMDTPIPCVSSNEIYYKSESSFDTKKGPTPSSQSAEKNYEEFENSRRDSIKQVVKAAVQNIGGIKEGSGNGDMELELNIKLDECGSTPSKDLVIVPDVKSLLYNFTKKRRKKTVTADESPNKRRLTGPTKLRENIILLMLHSTIVPFRHNSNFLNDYICYYCENSYKTMKELRRHQSEHDGKITDDHIMTLMRTRAHKLINADISNIKCRLCSQELKNMDSLIKHLTNIHKKIYHDTGKESLGVLGFDLGSDELKCHLCHAKCESFRGLFSHMNEHYEAYSCFCCQKKFANLLRYRTHMKSHVIQDGKEFRCDHCSAVCKSKTGLVYHMKRHHLNVTLKCDLCPQTFKFKEYRKRDEHMVFVHGIPKPDHKYTCDICDNGKSYSSSNTLKIHKSNVHKVGDVPRYECKLCDFVTHHTKRMSEHMDIHNGVKNYGCDLCGKRFTKPYTLRIHMRMHLNDKRYACSLCDDAYVHKSMLQYHMKKKHPDSDIVA